MSRFKLIKKLVNLLNWTDEPDVVARVIRTLNITETPAVRPPRIAPMIPGVEDSNSPYALSISVEKTRQTININAVISVDLNIFVFF